MIAVRVCFRGRLPAVEVDVEAAIDRAAASLAPRPGALCQLRCLPERRLFDDRPATAERITDADMQAVACRPLREIAVGELAAAEIAHLRVATRIAFAGFSDREPAE